MLINTILIFLSLIRFYFSQIFLSGSDDKIVRIWNGTSFQTLDASGNEIDEIDFDRENKIILACDDIQDPGNFGTIIRTADWFGIHNIVASKNTVDVFNQKVIQASMGSVFRVRVEYVDLKSWLMTSERRILGTLLEGTSIFDYKLETDSVVIIGNEGKGISSEIVELIQDKITIPAIGAAESLNAAVASGIILAELTQ